MLCLIKAYTKIIFFTTAFNILQKNDTTPGSESLCTTYWHIGMYHISFSINENQLDLQTHTHTPTEKHLVAIIVGALVVFLCICLLFVLIPIICCCCCIPGCILHSCRARRDAYQVIQWPELGPLVHAAMLWTISCFFVLFFLYCWVINTSCCVGDSEIEDTNGGYKFT